MSRKVRKLAASPSVISGSTGAENLGLPLPYPAAPYRPGKHCLYVHKGQGFMTAIFAATYSAKKYLDILLGDDEISKVKGITGVEDTIVSSTGIRVRCSEIQEIIDHKYSAKEEEWQIEEPHTTQALSFRSNSHDRIELSGPTAEGETPTRIKREKKQSTPKPSKEGLVSIAEIAAQLNMQPREARGILRDKKIPKPGAGWCWDKGEVDNIKQILHDNK